jgi:hypothetical protein
MQGNNSIAGIDSIQTQTLLNIMNNSNGLIATYARNILSSNGIVVYHEPYIFPNDSLKSSKIRHRISNEKYEADMMKIYPNPAKDYIIVEYTLNESPDNAKVELYDITGKNLKKLNLKNTHDWLVVPLQNLPGGPYICCLRTGNKTVDSVKFILVK